MADAVNTLSQAGSNAIPKTPAATGKKEVVVLPTVVDDFQKSKESLQAALTDLQARGCKITGQMKHALGFTAAVSGADEKMLKDAGFRVIEDRYVHLLPTRMGWPSENRRRQAFGPSNEGPSDYFGKQPLPYTGKGVTIAVLDSGIYPHPDLQGRIVAYADLAAGTRRPQDTLGHGTHVAGDAAGSGRMSGGQYHGLAPEANIAAVRVMQEDGGNRISEIVDNLVGGLEWCVENKERYNIRVANMSLGIPLLAETNSWGQTTAVYDPIGAAVNQAVQAGIAVVVAAGNDGDQGEGSISNSPAINPNVITVGALDEHQNRVADFSSRGPAPDGSSKPDVVAPGVQVMAPNAPGSELDRMNEHSEEIKSRLASMGDRDLERLAYTLVMNGMAPYRLLQVPPEELQQALLASIKTMPTEGSLDGSSAYIGMDGTSMASPVVAGLVAAMVSANPDLSPQQIKDILERTATPLRGEDQYAQGAGVVNPQEALRVAASTRGHRSEAARSERPQPIEQPDLQPAAPHRSGLHRLLDELLGRAA